jgi:hypothetical protein
VIAEYYGVYAGLGAVAGLLIAAASVLLLAARTRAQSLSELRFVRQSSSPALTPAPEKWRPKLHPLGCCRRPELLRQTNRRNDRQIRPQGPRAKAPPDGHSFFNNSGRPFRYFCVLDIGSRAAGRSGRDRLCTCGPSPNHYCVWPGTIYQASKTFASCTSDTGYGVRSSYYWGTKEPIQAPDGG